MVTWYIISQLYFYWWTLVFCTLWAPASSWWRVTPFQFINDGRFFRKTGFKWLSCWSTVISWLLSSFSWLIIPHISNYILRIICHTYSTIYPEEFASACHYGVAVLTLPTTDSLTFFRQKYGEASTFNLQ